MDFVTLKDFYDQGFVEIGRIGNTIYLANKFPPQENWIYCIVNIDSNNHIVNVVGLVNGRVISAGKV